MSQDPDLKQIRSEWEALNKTPGAWTTYSDREHEDPYVCPLHCCEARSQEEEDNGKAIVLAVNTLPALLSYAETLEARVAVLEAENEVLQRDGGVVMIARLGNVALDRVETLEAEVERLRELERTNEAAWQALWCARCTGDPGVEAERCPGCGAEQDS